MTLKAMLAVYIFVLTGILICNLADNDFVFPS